MGIDHPTIVFSLEALTTLLQRWSSHMAGLLRRPLRSPGALDSAGMEYKGTLKSIDQYMNLQLLNTEETGELW